VNQDQIDLEAVDLQIQVKEVTDLLVNGEKIMDIKYNANIGAFVNTANDEPVTQAELLEWAAANPEPLKEDKKPNTEILEEVIETFNKTG
jgi:ABC-type uncharacterized transport system YnjBCD substrate-binding protein